MTLSDFNSFPHIRTFNNLEKEAFENIVGKGENAGNQHFLLFPQMLSILTSLKFCCVVRTNDKLSDRSKLTGFADNKRNVTQKLKFVMGRVENIVGKRENAGYQHFLFPQCFQKPSYTGLLKVGIGW